VPNFHIKHSDTKENRPPSPGKIFVRPPGALKKAVKEAPVALPNRTTEKESQQQDNHKVQMDAVQAQFESLRQHRVQLLRDLAGARPSPAAPKPGGIQRPCSAPQPPVNFMTQHTRGEASRTRIAVAPPGIAGTPSKKRKPMVTDAFACNNYPPATPSPRVRATDPWAAFAVNRREMGNSVGSGFGTPGNATPSPQSSRTRSARPNPSSRLVASNARSVSPATDRLARNNTAKSGDIVQELRMRCGNISAAQRSIERVDKDFGPDSPSGPRCGLSTGSASSLRGGLSTGSTGSLRRTSPTPGLRGSQDPRQTSPAPSRPRAGFSTPGPPPKQVPSTPPCKSLRQRSPSRRMLGTPVNRPQPSPLRSRQPSPLAARPLEGLRASSPSLRHSASASSGILRRAAAARVPY